MFNFIKNLFNDSEKNLLAFEFGIIVSNVAKEHGIEVTPKIIKTAERIITEEFKTKTAVEIAAQLEVLTLSVFETE